MSKSNKSKRNRMKVLINFRKVMAVLIVAIIMVVINYLATPALTFRSAGFWWFMSIAALLLAIALYTANYWEDDPQTVPAVLAIASGVAIVFMAVMSIACSPMFNSDSYRNRVVIEEGDFSHDIASLDSVSLVDVATARKLGDRTVAQIANSTWYDVDDEYNLIEYNGGYYRISALNYGGLFKYNKAKSSGIPGYVMVNCKTQEAKFVRTETPYKYSPSAYFSNNLKRHLRHQYPSLVFGRSFFEIDDNGNPYWITSIKSPKLGLWSCRYEERFVVTDAVTGSSEIYATDDLPEWIDHAYDLGYLMTGTTDNYQYVNGFWNSLFSKTGVQKLSYDYRDKAFEGYTSAISANGEVVFFTGVTPANRAESIYGFVTANPRTGKVKFYQFPGAEESSAQAAAQGLISNFNYSANYPTIVDVNGVATYFMMLKDQAGLVQRYALVNLENYTIAVEDQTVQGVIAKYMEKISPADVSVTANTKTDTVAEVHNAIVGGYTYFYYTFVSDEGLYVSSIENGYRQVQVVPGDEIQVTYVPDKEPGVFLVTGGEF